MLDTPSREVTLSALKGKNLYARGANCDLFKSRPPFGRGLIAGKQTDIIKIGKMAANEANVASCLNPGPAE